MLKAKTVLKMVLRDNEIINFILRNILKVFIQLGTPFQKLSSYYRVFGNVILNIGGVRFKMSSKADDHIANEIFYRNGFDESEFLLLKELTSRSGYFIDVGANTGIFTIYIAKLRPNIKILSFEPHPTNFNRLTKNISINALNNVTAFQKALGASNSEIKFNIPSDLGISTISSVKEEFTSNFNDTDYIQISVEQKKLDDLLSHFEFHSFDVVKIDVEYYELEVLKGAKSFLEKARPIVMTEILAYEKMIAQFPEMKGLINENHASEIAVFFSNIGYYCYAIENERITSLRSWDEHESRNFLFLPKKLKNHHYTFQQILDALL